MHGRRAELLTQQGKDGNDDTESEQVNEDGDEDHHLLKTRSRIGLLLSLGQVVLPRSVNCYDERRMKPIHLLMATLFLPLCCAFGFETTKDFKKGLLETSLRSGLLMTNGNYDSGGSVAALPNGGKYQLIDFDLKGRYVLNTNWAFYAGTNLAYAESSSLGFDRRNSSLTSATAGVELAVDLGKVLLIPELAMRMPFEKTELQQDTVMNGEGVNETRVRVNFQSYLGSFIAFGHLGYDIRSGGRSHLFPWSAGAFYRTKSFDMGARLFGFQKASDDAAANSFAANDRLATSTRVNGGSLHFFSVNPSITNLEGMAQFHLNRKWSLGLSLGLTLAGVSYSQGFFGHGVLTFRPFPGESLRSRPSREFTPTNNNGPMSRDFSEDIDDGVDQEIFKAPPEDKPVDPFMEPPPEAAAPAVKPKARRVQKSNVIKDDSAIKKQLQDAEMTIELRTEPRKGRRRR